MADPCFERQKEVQDKLKITPAMSKAFMEETLNNIKAGMDTKEAIEAVAKKTGRLPATVGKILQADTKLFSINKGAFNRAGVSRQIKLAARDLAEGAHNPGKISQSWNVLRRTALAGHSPVFPFTHMRNLLYGNAVERGIFYRAVKKPWTYFGEKGGARYEMDMALLKLADHYEPFKSWGLGIGDGVHAGDTILKGMKGMSKKSFDSLKIARYELMKHYWDASEPALKTEAYGQMLARDMNYATGDIQAPRGAASTKVDRAVHAASQASGDVLLASKLFYAKRMEALNIVRHGTQLLLKGGKMTAEERAISNLAVRRWGRITATQLGILGVNIAFAKWMGAKLPNVTDPNKADFGRMRIGNFVVPLSPLMEAAREPVRVISAALKQRSLYEGGKEAIRPLMNALHPTAAFLMEQATGKESFSGQPVPSVRNLIQPAKSTQPAKSVLEYGTERISPIAVSGALHPFYQELRDNGVEASLATAFIKAAAGGATSGLAGTHIYEEHQRPVNAKGNPIRGSKEQQVENAKIHLLPTNPQQLPTKTKGHKGLSSAAPIP